MDRAALISCFEDTVRLSRKGKLARETERAIAASKVYFEGFTAPVSNERNENAFIEVETLTSFLAAKKYLQYGKVAVLNFANPENPGGGVKNGAMAQEECLCRSSNLFPCLEGKCIVDDFYTYHKQQRDHSFSDRLVYTPGVTVFKTDETYPKLLPENEWFTVDVITCAAPYQEKGRYVNPEYLLRLFTRRVKNILEAACDNQVDVLILGAFGCGAFRNPPQIVAQAFSQAIFEGSYQKRFKRIVFAIKPTREQCPNVSEFAGQFSCFSEASQYEASILPIPPDFRFSKTPALSYITDKGYNPEFSNWQSKNKYYGKQFSIIGDSISTFEGYNPKGYKVFYDESTGLKAGVLSAEDTWWDKVISFFGGELLVNNAWSGSRVTMLPGKDCDALFPSACSPERTSNLHQGDVTPDVIIINIGVNDWANGVETWYDDLGLIQEYYSSFDGAYDAMLRSVKKNYPNSEIWCCTLCETFIPHKSSFRFPHQYAGIHIEKYNESIQLLAQKYQCRTIDLYKYHIPYASMDGTHPTEEGMSTIASLIIHEVCGTEVETMVKDFPIRKPTGEEPEYIDSKPDATMELYSDTIELYQESTGQNITVQGEVIKAGRSNECDIVIPHPNASRHHATFFFEGSWYVRDENSTNKTILNGTPIDPGKKYKLYAGDVLSFGPEKYCFFKSRSEPQAPNAPKKFDDAAIAILESSIKSFVDSGCNDDTSFKLIITALSDAPLFLPVEIDVAAMLGNLDPTKLKAGDTIKPEKDVRIKVLTLKLEGDIEVVPLFTSTEEVNKGQSVSTMRYYPADYLPLLMKMEKHIVINPFSEHKFILTYDMIKGILKPVIDKKATSPIPTPPPIPRSTPKNQEDNMIGKTIAGKYKILSCIGNGGMSRTYLAMGIRVNKQWAVKVIHKKGNVVLLDSVRKQNHMLMKLAHPSIPQLIDIEEDDQNIYIVREYLQGESLDVLIKQKGAIPVETAIAWAATLCDVLSYLHTRVPALIYRDMKPANIVVHPDGMQLKLVDFGIMRQYDPKKTQDTTILGTKGYAAPEQYGGAGQTDARTDIFALGMTLHHMITGRSPIDTPYAPIRQYNPTFPQRLEDIISRCVEPDANKRFQTAEDLKKALLGEGPVYPKKTVWEKLFAKKEKPKAPSTPPVKPVPVPQPPVKEKVTPTLDPLRNEYVQVLTSCSSTPIGDAIEAAEYAISKIRYFRSKGLPEEELYHLEMAICLNIPAYIENHFDKYMEAVNHDITPLWASTERLIKANKSEQAYQISKPLADYLVKNKESQITGRHRFQNIHEEVIYLTEHNIPFKDSSEIKHAAGNYVGFFVTYAKLLQNLAITRQEFKGASVAYLELAKEMCDVNASVYLYTALQYMENEQLWRQNIDLALNYCNYSNGLYGMSQIYMQMGMYYMAHQNDELSAACFAAAIHYAEPETANACKYFMSKAGKYQTMSEQQAVDVLRRNHIQVGYSTLVRGTAAILSTDEETRKQVQHILSDKLQ